VTIHGDELFGVLCAGLHLCRKEPQNAEELLQLFIDDGDEFVRDLSSRRFADIWKACGSVTTITLLSQIFAKYLRSLTAKQRVRFIRTTLVADDSATLYMAKINQSHVKPSLNRFCRASVRTVLFDVTQAFVRFGSQLGDADYDLFAWKRIAIVAIKNGADPVAVRKFNPGNRSRTPLLSLFRLHKRRENIFKDISRPLKLWIQILREANVNLRTYFSEESRVWRCLLSITTSRYASKYHTFCGGGPRSQHATLQCSRL
jgi:hypothetical protein